MSKAVQGGSVLVGSLEHYTVKNNIYVKIIKRYKH